MSQGELTEAAADLAGLVACAEGRKEVVIVEGGHATAKLVAVRKPPRVHPPVQLGRLDGVFRVPDDFDAPLPDEILDMFEGRT